MNRSKALTIAAGVALGTMLIGATAEAEETQVYERRSVEVKTGAAATPPPAAQEHRVESETATQTDNATGEMKQTTRREESHAVQQPAAPPPAVVHERTIETHVEDDDD